MKPKIFHLLEDHSIGGITSTTRHLSSSVLQEEFDFRLVNSRELVALLRTDRPDLLIFRNPSSWRRSLYLALIKPYIPHVILHEHHYSASFVQHQVKCRYRFHAMLRLSYGIADRVVAISQGQANWLRQNHLLDEQKLIMIRQCPNLQGLVTVPPKTIQPVLTLGAYGRFCHQKGFDTLLQAMELIPDVEVHLNIGGYGNDQQKLQDLAQGLSNVKFWGAIDHDVPAFLAAADLVVIPSRWEPWGNVCIESRAAGKPIIASDVDGLSEQVKDCGLLVPPDDPQALANAIRQVTRLPTTQLETWGEKARASVQGAWELYLENWRSLLWQTLQSH